MEWNKSGDVISSMLAILMVLLLVLLPLLALYLLKKNFNRLNTPEVINTYGVLYAELKINNR
jgi:multisubunit Na+/H+ antiporter MnhG subunit